MKCPSCHFDNPSDTRFCGNCGAVLQASKEIPAMPTETIIAPKKS